jgi:hypothetical protein
MLLTDIVLMKTRFALSSKRRVGAGVEEEAAAGHMSLVKLLELPALVISSVFL